MPYGPNRKFAADLLHNAGGKPSICIDTSRVRKRGNVGTARPPRASLTLRAAWATVTSGPKSTDLTRHARSVCADRADWSVGDGSRIGEYGLRRDRVPPAPL